MDAKYACKSGEHLVARRQFLGAMAAAGAGACVGGLGVFTTPVIADQLRSDQKRIVVFNMAGGLSQLESWDPKPGDGDWRTIPFDCDVRAGNSHFRAAAGNRQANAPLVPGARREHE